MPCWWVAAPQHHEKDDFRSTFSTSQKSAILDFWLDEKRLCLLGHVGTKVGYVQILFDIHQWDWIASLLTPSTWCLLDEKVILSAKVGVFWGGLGTLVVHAGCVLALCKSNRRYLLVISRFYQKMKCPALFCQSLWSGVGRLVVKVKKHVFFASLALWSCKHWDFFCSSVIYSCIVMILGAICWLLSLVYGGHSRHTGATDVLGWRPRGWANNWALSLSMHIYWCVVIRLRRWDEQHAWSQTWSM